MMERKEQALLLHDVGQQRQNNSLPFSRQVLSRLITPCALPPLLSLPTSSDVCAF